MATERTTCDWPGASGTKYKYWVYERHPKINEGQDGNYIYAKIENNTWQPVYIGEGDLSKRATSDHHRTACIDKKQATHVHVHTNGTKESRRAEERDLLANFPQAYAPTGCNVKEGG
jgi:hypothetical protein